MLWWRRACDAATSRLPSYRSTGGAWRRENKRNIGWKLWMLHEAINWNFLEFSPSSIFFRTIYSLIVFHLVRGLNLIHLTVFDRARAKNISSAKSSRFRITECGNGRKKSPDSRRASYTSTRENLNNVQLSIGYGVHLPALPNYIWPFPFPARTASLFISPSRNSSPRAVISWISSTRLRVVYFSYCSSRDSSVIFHSFALLFTSYSNSSQEATSE